VNFSFEWFLQELLSIWGAISSTPLSFSSVYQMLQNHSWQSRLRLASFSTHFSVRKYRMKQYVSCLILYCYCKLGWSPFWVFWLQKRPKHPWNANISVPFVTSMILCFPRWTFLCVRVAFQYGVTDYCLRIIFELYVFTVILRRRDYLFL